MIFWSEKKNRKGWPSKLGQNQQNLTYRTAKTHPETGQQSNGPAENEHQRGPDRAHPAAVAAHFPCDYRTAAASSRDEREEHTGWTAIRSRSHGGIGPPAARADPDPLQSGAFARTTAPYHTCGTAGGTQSQIHLLSTGGRRRGGILNPKCIIGLIRPN